ncbi:Integral membrane protein TerC [Rickettsiales bacterium Ac37b]|nr:Integral membrane protein TerC [Rickettsiales bacterium Ac37b]
MELLFTFENLLNLFILTGLEIVLGIDNVIFIALLVQSLNEKDRFKVRFIGLSLALILRVLMLMSASKIITLTQPLFTFFHYEFSGKSLLLIFGGLFLIIKPLLEFITLFQEKGQTVPHMDNTPRSFWHAIFQVILIDFILSFDSVITAVGMSNHLPIIVTAVVIAMIVMIVSSKAVSDFIYKYQNIKIMALAFIMLLGVFLVANGFNIYIPKGYLYFSMMFSVGIETISILLNKKTKITNNIL